MREGLAKLDPTSAEYAKYKQLWWEKCEQPKSTPPQDECTVLRVKLSKLDPSSADYQYVKNMWQKKCETPPTPTGEIQCWKNGCMVKCQDGTSFNSCMCGGPTSVPTWEGPVGPSTLPDGTGKSMDDGVRCSTQHIGKCDVTRCTDGSIKRVCKKDGTTQTTNTRTSRRSLLRTTEQ
jgi:hypothetical protein